jgi:LacI family transcriptional regulator
MKKHYATLKDVAEKAGTTAATASYVLSESGKRYISSEMRQRVLDAATELNYIKCSGASSLRGKKRKIIAVLVPQFENQFFTRIVLAVEQVFDKHGYILSICNTFDDAERERTILNRMQQQRVDGYVLTPTREGTANTAHLRKMGVPIVMVDRPLEGLDDFFWVTTSNYRCGYVATEHLIDKGHRHIGFIGWDSCIPDLVARQQAFFDAGRDHGIDADSFVAIDGGFTPDEGYRMTKALLEEHPDVTAILYGYNIQAKGGIRCLMELGVDIPKAKSVVIIGSPEWASAGRNNFTHVDQGDYELGCKAANLLLEVINGDGKVPVRHIIQECTLVEGDTVYAIGDKERQHDS